ncbi:hypothetical protein WA026_009260 [Henosepilachna vigintioctopunctata]
MMFSKWSANEPYYLFFNKLASCAETIEHINAVFFKELLCPSMGQVKCSLHITNTVDVRWLMSMYALMNIAMTPVTLIYGTLDKPNDFDTIKYQYPMLTYARVATGPYSKHNSKMSIFKYHDNSVRIVIYTADLTDDDWSKCNNGLWISPACPPVSEDTGVEKGKNTYFKPNLIYYLDSYRMDIISPWVETIRIVDFSSIKVFLITSIPGEHQKGRDNHLNVVANLLKKHCVMPKGIDREENKWKIIGVSPSIGDLGKYFSHWLKLFVTSLSHHKRYKEDSPHNRFNFIYPSDKNIKQGCRMQCTTRYTREQHDEQIWFQRSMRPWKANLLRRTKVMPHIKCYTRISPCLKKSVYLLLTSADLGPEGWGLNVGDRQVMVRNYELGILFIPRFFDEEMFEIEIPTNNRKVFPIIFDLPLRRYQTGEEPWLS